MVPFGLAGANIQLFFDSARALLKKIKKVLTENVFLN
jgi:hypothetical protein